MLEEMRETLYQTMWDDAGIVRNAQGLSRVAAVLEGLAAQLAEFRLPAEARDRTFNLTWHDALNLDNLISVSRAIIRAAQARENSCGAHYRTDFPAPGDLASSTFTSVRSSSETTLTVTAKPVNFSRVRPGQSLVAAA